jgi:hypothetical protein
LGSTARDVIGKGKVTVDAKGEIIYRLDDPSVIKTPLELATVLRGIMPGL